MAKKSTEEYEVSDHQLSISSLFILFKLFRKNKVDKQYRGRVMKILLWAVLTQPFHWLQKLILWPRLWLVDFFKEPPTFVIGHWRSGTTHLHYILSRDPQFAYLTNYQALFLRMAFVGKGVMDRIVDYFMPETRPQDNIKMNAYEPAEEEQPFTNMTVCSGMQSWFFPQNQTYFDKYNLFKGINKGEKRRWRRKYRYLLKMISLANKNKPLLLKNPHNTGRVKELLELFPKARFIFIHRHPFDVYLSMKHLFDKMISTQFLQHISDEDLDRNLIYYYTSTMQKYLDERHLIPDGQLSEISFNELEEDPKLVIKRIYEELSIPNFDKAQPAIETYLDSVKDYKKNEFRLPDEEIDVLLKEWQFAFDEWNYQVHREEKSTT